MDVLSALFGRGGYLPHGYCFTWSPGLLWSMVGADTAIAAAYFSIPVALVSFVRRRADVSLRGVAWLFSAFIFACGVTHVMEIWTIWWPDYGAQATAKAITAAISVTTAVALWWLLPQALRIPSVRQLRTAIETLEAEARRRRSVEEQLADTQQSLSVTLDSIGAGFVATDRNGCITRMNAVAEQTLGWPQALAQGKPVWEVVVREGQDVARARHSPLAAMATGTLSANESRMVVALARDGRRVEMELHSALTYAEDSTVRGLVMVFRDLSQLMHAAAESSRLAAIVESSFDAIIGKTLDGRITNWNRAAQTMFGYSAQEAIGRNVKMLISPEREVEEMRILAAVSRGVQVPAFDTVRLTKAGRPLEVSVTISPIRDAHGHIVGASKIARDVSLQRRAEAALRASEARLRFTLESAQIGDWDLDLASGVIQRSQRFDRCLGFEQLQPNGTFDAFVQHVHPEDREEVVRGFNAAVAGLSDWSTECRVVWPDGTHHWIAVHASLASTDGRATHMLGIISDVTQQRQAEQARLTAQRLEAENRQIQAASRLKSQFLANMSHELRTPLNAVIGFADLLHSGAVAQDTVKHRLFLEHIGNSGRHLLQLINDVLDLSKVEAGKFEFFPERVDLGQLVRECGEILHTAMQRKHQRFSADIDPALDDIVVDASRLKQALYNYLSNAIKFTDAHGTITVRALAEGPHAFRLEVEDSGMGIAAVDIPRLFAEFQQLDAGPDKQHQGTGLGLALTRRLVQAQGGSVGVRSEPGRGSVFHLVLPRHPVPVAPAAPALVLGGTGSDRHRILVIDADGGLGRGLSQALGQAGFVVDAASTPEQALHRARGHSYDAMTLDLMMPERGGLAVLAHIRSEGRNPNAPVVGLSMPSHDGGTAAFAVANVLAKPIRVDEVVLAMARLRGAAQRHPRVLVIDDDAAALELMRTTLAGIGIEAVGMLDGRQALRDLAQVRPDAIVLDLMMPGCDGFEVLDALQQMAPWRDTPVYIWTSMNLTDQEFAQLSRSAQAILSKGGGALQTTLEALRRWRPPVVAAGLGESG